MIILQDFGFDKTYHLALKKFTLVHPESAPSVHPGMHFLKEYFFVSCFPTISLNKTKLKYGTMKLKAYEKIIWMTELVAIYILGPNGSLLWHLKCAI